MSCGPPSPPVSTAVSVVRRRTSEMPDRAVTVVQVLATQVDYFERLVSGLARDLQPRRGSRTRHSEPVDLLSFLRRVSSQLEGPPPEVDTAGPWTVTLDSRRVERIMGNPHENADRYAQGVTRLGSARRGDRIQITVDDGGPGIAPSDRERIFERFGVGRWPVRRPAVAAGWVWLWSPSTAVCWAALSLSTMHRVVEPGSSSSFPSRTGTPDAGKARVALVLLGLHGLHRVRHPR